MTKQELLQIVRNQLAVDYNCKPEDFQKDGVIITKAVKADGRRALPFRKTRCEMITMGHSVIVNASEDVLPFVKKRLAGKSRYETLNAPFVYGVNPHYLPGLEHLKQIDANPNFAYRVVERAEIPRYYAYKGLHNALLYNSAGMTTETLGVAAWDGARLAGIGCAIADSEKMCQIGVDVLPEYRNQGIATAIVNKLAIETLNRGYIPYYFTDNSNVASQKTAIAAGFFPAWAHCYQTRLVGRPFAWVNYLKF